jgi:GNAT superfamily N-acetyltransferase
MWHWLERTTRDLWLLFRQEGLRAALEDIRDGLRRRLYTSSDQLILVKRLTSAEPPPAGAVPVRVDAADARHLPVLAEYNRRRSNMRRTDAFRRSLARGEHAWLCFIGDELVGYFWWMDSVRAAEGFYLDRFGITLEDNEVYGYEFSIAPEYRAGGTATAFLAHVEAELARRGYERMYGFVESWNVGPRWLYSVRGYEVIRRVRTRTVLGRLVVIDRAVFLSGRNGLRRLLGGSGGIETMIAGDAGRC